MLLNFGYLYVPFRYVTHLHTHLARQDLLQDTIYEGMQFKMKSLTEDPASHTAHHKVANRRWLPARVFRAVFTPFATKHSCVREFMILLTRMGCLVQRKHSAIAQAPQTTSIGPHSSGRNIARIGETGRGGVGTMWCGGLTARMNR